MTPENTNKEAFEKWHIKEFGFPPERRDKTIQDVRKAFQAGIASERARIREAFPSEKEHTKTFKEMGDNDFGVVRRHYEWIRDRILAEDK